MLKCQLLIDFVSPNQYLRLSLYAFARKSVSLYYCINFFSKYLARQQPPLGLYWLRILDEASGISEKANARISITKRIATITI